MTALQIASSMLYNNINELPPRLVRMIELANERITSLGEGELRSRQTIASLIAIYKATEKEWKE